MSDRTTVWEKLIEITRDLDCHTYICPGKAQHDGRVGYQGLWNHYLGANSVDNMSSDAEKTLQKTSYHGEQRHWNFEKFIKIQVDAHAILEGLVVHGYSGIDNCSKVQHLLEGIKTPKLNPVKTQIMANLALRQDYPACVTLFKDFIKQDNLAPNVRDAAISAVGSTRHDSDEWNDVEPDMTVED